MRIISGLVQGSDEWIKLRAGYFTASEAPAMLGLSKYKARAALVREKATGIVPEVDSATQRRFDDGHAAEEKMRAWAENYICDDLYPVVGVYTISGLPLLSSFDGLTMDGKTAWENKLWNEGFAEQVRNGIVPDTHWPQLEQQLLISGADYVLFTVGDGENAEPLEYRGLPERRERLLAGWAQFAADVLEYQRKLAAGEIEQPKEAPKAETIKALPSVFVQATGMVTASNLSEFKEAATTFIAGIKTELVCDQDFADAESTVKFCKDAESNLEATKASVLAQMSTVDEVVRTLDHIAAQLRDKRLMLDKLVKSEKETRKLAIVTKAGNDFAAHVESLEAETKPIRLVLVRPDFAGAIKGMKKLSAMQEAVDTALRDGKFSADQSAKDVREKLAWCKELSVGYGFLFSDLSQLIANNGMEAFQAIVTGRIDKHKVDEAAKAEEQRAAIQAEEERKATAKAQAEAEAIIAAERAKQAEEQAKARAEAVAMANREQQAAQERTENNPKSEAVTHDGARPSVVPQRPTDKEIIAALAETFNVPRETVVDWLMNISFASVEQ